MMFNLNGGHSEEEKNEITGKLQEMEETKDRLNTIVKELQDMGYDLNKIVNKEDTRKVAEVVFNMQANDTPVLLMNMLSPGGTDVALATLTAISKAVALGYMMALHEQGKTTANAEWAKGLGLDDLDLDL